MKKAFFTIIIATIVLSTSADAFLGIRGSIGGALDRVVGTGGGLVSSILPGMIEERIPGLGLGGATGGILGIPGQAFFGSTIRDWENANGRSIEKAGAQLNTNIEKFGATLDASLKAADVVLGKTTAQLDDLLAKNTAALNQVFQSTTADIDAVLTSAIDRLDESLDKQVGSLDTVSVKFSAAIERVFRQLIWYGCIIVLISFASWHFYKELYQKKGPLLRASINVVALAAMLIVISIISYFLPSQMSERALMAKHIDSYKAAYAIFDFRRAKYHANQLRVIDSNEQYYDGLLAKARVSESVLLRPVTYATEVGLGQLEVLLAQAQRNLGQERATRDGDLQAISAFLIRQRLQNKFGDLLAANYCAQYAEVANEKRASLLSAMCLQYLSNYLMSPIPDEYFTASIGRSIDEENNRLRNEGGENAFQYRLTATLVSARERLSNIIHSDQTTDPGVLAPIRHLLKMDALLTELYNSVLPSYVQMVRSNAIAAVQSDPEQKKKAISDRKQLAEGIIKAFVAFDNALASGDLDGTSARYAAIKGLHAIYSRAQMFKSINEEIKPVPGDEKLDNAIHRKWIALQIAPIIGSNVDTSSIRLLRNIGDLTFRKQEEVLLKYEAAVMDLEKTPNEDAVRRTRLANVGFLSATLGLAEIAQKNNGNNHSVLILQSYKVAAELRTRYGIDSVKDETARIVLEALTSRPAPSV